MSKLLGIDKAIRFFDMIRMNGGIRKSYLKLFRYVVSVSLHKPITNDNRKDTSVVLFGTYWLFVFSGLTTLNQASLLAKINMETNILRIPTTFTAVIAGSNTPNTYILTTTLHKFPPNGTAGCITRYVL